MSQQGRSLLQDVRSRVIRGWERPEDANSSPSIAAVMWVEMRCMLVTLHLLAASKITMPLDNVGRKVRFTDGTVSTIYRETVLEAPSVSPVVLVVRFRLRLVGLNRVAHALFRLESLLNTVLFAGHHGFRTKLWLTDLDTGFYRGIYEWDGGDAARIYAETLRVVLAPWVEGGTFAYQVIDVEDRECFLDGSCQPDSCRSAWWALPESCDGLQGVPGS